MKNYLTNNQQLKWTLSKKNSLLFKNLSLTLIFLISILNFSHSQTLGCTGTIFDSGGAAGNYSNNESITETYCSNLGNQIKLTFTSFDIEQNFDYLFIYDGPDSNSPILGVYTNSTSPGAVVSTNGCLTIVFESDASTTLSGYSADISCVNACDVVITGSTFTSATCGFDDGTITITANGAQGTIEYSIDAGQTYFSSGLFTGLSAGIYEVSARYDDETCTTFGDIITINSGCNEICNNGLDDDGDLLVDGADSDCVNTIYTCIGNYYDAGGPAGNYPFGVTNEVTTYCSDNNAQISLTFTEFSLNIGVNADTMLVFDGADTLSPIIGKYIGNAVQNTNIIKSFFLSTNGCLTFQFKTDAFNVSSGWAANIACTNPVAFGKEICGNGIDDDFDGMIDSQDPDCPESLDITTCQQGFTYYVPPVWKMGGTETEYTAPAILCLSTAFPSASVNIRTEDGSFDQNFNLTNLATQNVIFDESTEILRTDVFNTPESSKGLIVTSDFPVQLLFKLDGRLNKNLMTIKGKEAFGKSFRVGTQTNTALQSAEGKLRNERHFISVMATEDNTDVTFTFTTPIEGLTSPHTVNLDAGESYLVINEDLNVTLSGSLVTSSKEITVASGSQHTSASGVTEDDGGVDMLVPARSVGTDYILMRGGVFPSQDYGIVVATENNTMVFANNVFVASLNAGEFVQVNITGSLGEGTYINTSKRSYLYHVSGLSLGEVGMAIVAPIGECRGEDFASFSRFNATAQFALNLIIRDAGLPSLQLNGIALNSINYPTTIIQPVASFPGYSTVSVRDADISTDNIVTSDEFFNAAIIIGDPINSGTFGYITSFSEKVNIIEPFFGESVEFYVLDTICRNGVVNHTLSTLSCGNTDKIRSIQQGTLGTATVTGDLSFQYTSNGTPGDDVIQVTVINEFGIQSAVCIGIKIDSVLVDLIPDTSICSGQLINLNITSLGGQGPYGYLWSTGEITPSINVSPAVNTVYSVTVTDNNSCTGSDAVNVTVSPSIVADAGPNSTICSGEIANLAAVQPIGTTGSWSGGTGTFGNPANNLTTYSPGINETSGVVKLFWTLDGASGNQCFMGTDSMMVTISPSLTVFAGDDTYICEGSSLLLSTLNAQINSTTVTTGTWTRNGDGLFMPGNTPTATFPTAQTYVPGPLDISKGFVNLRLDANSGSTCGSGFDVVVLYIQDNPVLVCNDNLNISVNKSCTVEITVGMLLENITGPEDFYIITLKDEFGNPITGTTLNSAYIGRTIEYSVTYLCGGNTCWGNLTIEDKQIPDLTPSATEIDCREDISPEAIGFPVPNTATVFVSNGNYYVSNFDGCGDVLLEYTDNVIDNGCSATFQTVIFRNWKATDESGNMSTGQDTINIRRILLSDIDLPRNYDDIDLPSLSCSGNYPVTVDGYPSPDFTGYPDAGTCSLFESTYKDLKFGMCGNTYKVVREWLIFDWCTSTSIKYFQTIKITDKTPPVINCPQNQIESTDYYSCNSGLILLKKPEVTDNCSTVSLTAKVTGPNGEIIPVISNSGNLVVADLPIGISIVRYTASDECENTSTCSYTITVFDNVPPTPVCEAHTKVSMNNVGTTRLYATSVDDGSYDNCAIQSIRIAKMTDKCGFGINKFGPYVDFCCLEIGAPIMVALEITDIYGNTNVCMSEVELEDKIAPIIIAPTDLTISCTTSFDEEDLSDFGKIALNALDRMDIIIFDEENNGKAGIDGLALDNCSLTITEEIDIDVDCGVGEIRRTFTAIDAYNQKASDVQIIKVVNSSPFGANNIFKPSDKTIDGCSNIDTDPSVTGRPTFTNEDCSSIVTSYEDKTFNTADSACLLILREWKILDMCQYNPNTGAGLWKVNQSIKVINNVAPTFTSTCQDTLICSYGACEGPVTLNINAIDDCTDASQLVYAYSLDFNDDGTKEISGNGNTINRTLDDGIYRVRWVVEDKCGNQKSCNYLLTVKDCKAPTPYCLGGISTALMNTNGMVEITAQSFDFGSYDNCSDSTNLQISFSSNTNDITRIYTCDSLENGVGGIFTVNIWVTDEAGNQDYCTAKVKVEDHFDNCPNVGTSTITGSLEDYKQNDIPNTSIKLTSDFNQGNLTIISDDEGSYAFGNLPSGINYNVTPTKNDDMLNGVTTLDIILIQKHILGLQEFTDAKQFIAADVNHSESVSGVDIIQIRKAILGFYTEYPNNNSWRFVDKTHSFSNNEYFTFPEYVAINPLNGNYDAANFLGIKIGDINGSATPQLTNEQIETRSSFTFEMENVDNTIRFISTENMDIEGVQFELVWNGGNLLTVEGDELAINTDHINVLDNSLKLSYAEQKAARLHDESIAFSLIFEEGTDMNEVMNTIVIAPTFVKPELYDTYLSTFTVNIEERSNIVNIHEEQFNMVLYQNTPNPFDGKTFISYELPNADQVELLVIDASGKLMYKSVNQSQKGFNQVELTKEELSAPGVYYYQINTSYGSATKKMILMH